MNIIHSEAVAAFMEQLSNRRTELYELGRTNEAAKQMVDDMDNLIDDVVTDQIDGTGGDYRGELMSGFIDTGLSIAAKAFELGKDVIVVKLDEGETDEMAYYFIGTEADVLEILKEEFAKFLKQ